MDVPFELLKGLRKYFASYNNMSGEASNPMKLLTQNDHTSCAITHLLVLTSTELNHVFGSRVGYIYLSEDRVAIICEPMAKMKGDSVKNTPTPTEYHP